MAKAIWKFTILVTDAQQVSMPQGAEILTVQLKNGVPCVWAMVDTDAKPTERVIEIFGTGNPVWVDMGVQRKYIGTFQQSSFVWHVFEAT